MVFTVFVALDDAVASEAAYGFIGPVVFRNVREVFGHIRIDDRQEGIEAAGQGIDLFLHRFFPFRQAVRGVASCLVAALADAEGNAAAIHVFASAEGRRNIDHDVFIRPVEGADGRSRFAFVTADGSCNVPLGISIEFERMQVGQCRCVSPDFVDAAVQLVDLVFNARDAFIGLIELGPVDGVRAIGRKVTGCHVDNLLIVGVDAAFADVSLVTDLVGRSGHAASNRSVAANAEVFFHSDYIFKGSCAIEGGRAGDVERIRRRAASNCCTIVDDKFICRRCPVYSQVFLNRSVGFHGDVAFQVRCAIDS